MDQDLYLLQDGTHAAKGDVSPGKDGVLRSKNGLAVCVDANGEPQTVQSDAVRNKNVEAAKVGPAVDTAPAPHMPAREPVKPGDNRVPVGAATTSSTALPAQAHNTIGPGHTEKLE